MKTFSDIASFASGMAPELVTELGRIERGRGREELHRQQAPQVLERLAAQTRFESITASNAIENVIVEPKRAVDLIQQESPTFRDRTEREFAGYKDAIDYLINKEPEPLSVPLVLHVHRQLMRHTDDPLAGQLKVDDNYIGDRMPDGSTKRVFKTVAAGSPTHWHMSELVSRYEDELKTSAVHPLILTSALIVDLLAIHPFSDGNGRVARLLTTNELLRHGYGIARYISLEQRIYDSKNSYYQALRESQTDWHAANHNLWPWTGYLLRLLADAYDDFEAHVVAQRALRGATKQEQARDYILHHAPSPFRWTQVVAALPDISPPTIRKALNKLRVEGLVSAGQGRSAQWTRLPASAEGDNPDPPVSP